MNKYNKVGEVEAIYKYNIKIYLLIVLKNDNI